MSSSLKGTMKRDEAGYAKRLPSSNKFPSEQDSLHNDSGFVVNRQKLKKVFAKASSGTYKGMSFVKVPELTKSLKLLGVFPVRIIAFHCVGPRLKQPTQSID